MILPNGIDVLLLFIPGFIYFALQWLLYRILPSRKKYQAFIGIIAPVGAILIWTEPIWVIEKSRALPWVMFTFGLFYLWLRLLLIYSKGYQFFSKDNQGQSGRTQNTGWVLAFLGVVGLLLIPVVFWTLIELGLGS